MRMAVFQVIGRDGVAHEFATEDIGFNSWIPAQEEVQRLGGELNPFPGPRPSRFFVGKMIPENPKFLRFEDVEVEADVAHRV